MMVDIYLRSEEHPWFNPTEMEVSDPIEKWLQEVEMILTTPNNSVFGEPEFGVDLESYLWKTRVSTNEIKTKATSAITKWVKSEINIPWTVEVDVLNGNINEGIVVDIIVDTVKMLGIAVR